MLTSVQHILMLCFPRNAFPLTKAKGIGRDNRSLSSEEGGSRPSASETHKSQGAGPLQSAAILFPLPSLPETGHSKNYY